MDHSVSGNSGARAAVDTAMSGRDRAILRELAARVAALAARECEQAKRELWYSHNALEDTRPVIFCDPENGWGEIILPEHIRCEGELARSWEIRLRKELFWGEHMGDDRVTDGRFDVPYIYSESDWGVKETQIGGGSGHAYTWEAPIRDYARDMDRLRFPEITVNRENTERLLGLAHELFDGLLEVGLKGTWWWSLGMTRVVIKLRGLEQFMLDMYDYPDELHRLMAFMRDGHMRRLDYLEENGLLPLNNQADYVGSGGFGWTNELPQSDFTGHVRTKDMWGFCESQETSTVSPEMFAEFVFPYQLPILERFGLNCYGCCEGLDKRWSVVKRIPRLRRVSVSPWADAAKMAELLGEDYIYSFKPNPAHLAAACIDEDFIRKNLREAVHTCKANGCRMEIIMKDNNTIGNNPDNVSRWCAIAREEAERY